MPATTLKKDKTDDTLSKEAELKKEAIISAFFEKKAEEAKAFLRKNPIPAELLKRNSKG
jgi:hypothetical protein